MLQTLPIYNKIIGPTKTEGDEEKEVGVLIPSPFLAGN